MRITLYMDEDAMDRDLVDALRLRGVDVLTALDASMIAHPDDRHLDFAASIGRVLYSHNVGDFAMLHKKYVSNDVHHAGIILARQMHFSLGDQIKSLLRIVSDQTAEQMVDRLEFLSSMVA